MTTQTASSFALASALRRWRLLHDVKQAHAAALFGVAQSTVSRWEAGQQAMNSAERARVEALVAARLDSAADRVLATLVSESPRAVHLMCDLTHRLLACSPTRANEFRVPVDQLIGRSLLCYATEEINVQERALLDRGWFDESVPTPVEFDTGENRSRIVPIWPSRCRWTRLLLSDGTTARLVETIKRFGRSSRVDRPMPPTP